MNMAQRMTGFVLLTLFTIASPVAAAPVEWTTASGGNGHFYELVLERLSWTPARDAAAALSFLGSSGHLVTITSSAENTFLVTTFDAATNSFVWIGASDALEEGRWIWAVGPEAGTQFTQRTLPAPPVATAPFFFQNWGPVEPNNFNDEDAAALNLGGLSTGGTTKGQWGDTDLTTTLAGYIVEYSGPFAAPVPVPASLLLVAAGLVGLAVRAGRRAS